MWIKSSGLAHHSVARWEHSSKVSCSILLPSAPLYSLLGCCWSWDWVCCCPSLPKSPLLALSASWILAVQVVRVWEACRRWPFPRRPRSYGSADSCWGSRRRHVRGWRCPCWIFKAEWIDWYGVITEETMVHFRIFLLLLRVREESGSEDLTVTLKRSVDHLDRHRDGFLHAIIKLISFIETPISRPLLTITHIPQSNDYD